MLHQNELIFVFNELDTDYEAVIYGVDISEDYVLSVLRLESQSLWRKELSHLEIIQYPKSQKSPRLQTCIIGYFGIRGCPKAW
jgi:hypothetical protein